MNIEKAIETQQKFITNWEQRIQELEEVIKKYPWGRDGLEYDFGDWRESELRRRKEQIKIALIIISALEKQIPKKDIENEYGLRYCPICGCELWKIWSIRNEVNHCYKCGQKINWSEVEV